MHSITVVAALLVIGYGFAAGGFLGSLTGLVAAIGVGSGVAIARDEASTMLSTITLVRIAQRIGGLFSAMGCVIGAYHGGWQFGWGWGIGGYLFGGAAALLLQVVMRQRDNVRRTLPMPSQFDLEDPTHVLAVDDIRQSYFGFLADESRPYGQCLYCPAAFLPYPKEVISRALTALLDFVEGRRESTFFYNSLRNVQVSDDIRKALTHLEDFLEIEAENLPTDRLENVRTGSRLKDDGSHPER